MDTTSRFKIDAYELAKKSKAAPAPDTKPPKAANRLECLQLSPTVPPNVDLIGAGDEHLGLAYAYLGAVQYGIDANSEYITLHHSLYEVTIKGIGLEPVYEALLERKALWIRQVDMNFIRRYEKLEASNDNEPDTGPMVSDIRFVKAG